MGGALRLSYLQRLKEQLVAQDASANRDYSKPRRKTAWQPNASLIQRDPLARARPQQAKRKPELTVLICCDHIVAITYTAKGAKHREAKSFGRFSQFAQWLQQAHHTHRVEVIDDFE